MCFVCIQTHCYTTKTNSNPDYAAKSPSEGTHCIGVASASSPSGPFNPTSTPLACATAGGGAIDASGFQDTDGTRYVVYKVDGSSLGGGGPCGNADGSHSTPIMLQKLTSDGLSSVGSPVQILDRGQSDGPLIEAPNLLLQNGV
jgi:beta-xylosidase